MAKDAIVSEELAKKFATEKDTPYLRWIRAEGLDIIGAHYVPQSAHGRAKTVATPRRLRGVSSTTRLRALRTTATFARLPPARSSRRSASCSRR